MKTTRRTIPGLLVGAASLILTFALISGESISAAPLANITPSGEPATQVPATQVPATQVPATQVPATQVPPTETPKPTRKPRPEGTPDPQIADPWITKAASLGEVRVGDTVDFTLTVTNRGTVAAEDVVVRDEMPEALDLIDSDTSSGSISTEGRTVIIDLGTVDPGEVITIHLRTRVNDRAQPPGMRNSVSLTSSSGSDVIENNSASAELTIAAPIVTPTPELTPIMVPTATPEAAPPIAPRRMPPSGAADSQPNPWLPLVALGLCTLGLSLWLRYRSGRTQR